jgi:branched-chain amino acid transport system ATP-binding protein
MPIPPVMLIPWPVMHLMKVLIEISDRLMIIHNGARIAMGPPQEVAKDKKVIEVYLGEEYARRL